MSFTLGIDVGTTYVAAALCRRRNADAFEAGEVVTLGTRSTVAPSVVFVGDDGRWLIGEPAERRAQERPELVVREFKRRIGDQVPMLIGESLLLPEVLAARVARWVLDHVTQQEGTAPDAVVVTHPASWGAYKCSRLRAALDGAGMVDASLVPEPVAAAAHYAAQARVADGKAVAVYDLGGGTFDAAIVRKVGDDSFELLGTPHGLDGVGGLDFDEQVFRYVQRAASLPRPDPGDADALVAMLALRRECAEAKEGLSSDTETTIRVLLPQVHTRVRLVRSDFESLIHDAVAQTAETLVATVADAGLDIADLDAVLLVGGSSRIPLVSQILSARLRRPLVLDADPKTAVALGAARVAAIRLRSAELVAASTAAAPPAAAAVADTTPILRRPASEPVGAGPVLRPTRRRVGRVVVAASAILVVGGSTIAASGALHFGAVPRSGAADRLVIPSGTGTPSPDVVEPPTAAVEADDPTAAISPGAGAFEEVRSSFEASAYDAKVVRTRDSVGSSTLAAPGALTDTSQPSGETSSSSAESVLATAETTGTETSTAETSTAETSTDETSTEGEPGSSPSSASPVASTSRPSGTQRPNSTQPAATQPPATTQPPVDEPDPTTATTAAETTSPPNTDPPNTDPPGGGGTVPPPDEGPSGDGAAEQLSSAGPSGDSPAG